MERGATEADIETAATALATVKQQDPTLYEATEQVLYTLMGGVAGNWLTRVLESLAQ